MSRLDEGVLPSQVRVCARLMAEAYDEVEDISWVPRWEVIEAVQSMVNAELGCEAEESEIVRGIHDYLRASQ